MNFRNDKETEIETIKKLKELGITKSVDECYDDYINNRKYLKSYKIIQHYIRTNLCILEPNPYSIGRVIHNNP